VGALDLDVARSQRRIVFERPWVFVFDAPAGTAWHWRDESHETHGSICRELKFRVTTDDAVLVLSVKDYAGPGEGRVAPDDLLARDWQRAYGGLFSEIEALQTDLVVQAFTTCRLPAIEVVALGMGRMCGGPAPIVVRERYVPIDRHMLVVSAMGARSLVEQHALEVERWFDSVVFRV
jgi:hypothetical protein